MLRTITRHIGRAVRRRIAGIRWRLNRLICRIKGHDPKREYESRFRYTGGRLTGRKGKAKQPYCHWTFGSYMRCQRCGKKLTPWRRELNYKERQRLERIAPGLKDAPPEPRRTFPRSRRNL